MSAPAPVGSPELRDGIACLIGRFVQFPVRTGDGVGSEAGLVLDNEDVCVCVADPNGDLPDETAKVIAEAIALALNAASGWDTPPRAGSDAAG